MRLYTSHVKKADANNGGLRKSEGEGIGAKAMSEWQMMRVDGDRLQALASKGAAVEE